jgi:hypothetical protein
MYKSRLTDPEFKEYMNNLRDARESGYSSVFRDRSKDVDPKTNNVWITRDMKKINNIKSSLENLILN